MGMQAGAATLENRMEAPQKTENRNIIASVIPLLGQQFKKLEGKETFDHRQIFPKEKHSIQLIKKNDPEKSRKIRQIC